MVTTTSVTIAVTNTRQALAATRTPCSFLSLQGDPANAAAFYHGDLGVTTANGEAVTSGGGGGEPQYPPLSNTMDYDLSAIYVIGTANDIVRVRYGVR